MSQPLMPHATACWLIENTALSFPQIADFCGLHMLEVQAIADDTASIKYTARDPVRAHELTPEEIKKGEANADYVLKISKGNEPVRRTKGPRYTPVSKRQDKPDGIAWILRNHPEITDGAIGRLIGTTRTTIAAIRDRTHWNIANITPKDPVTLGLCSQRELDAIVAKAAKKAGLEAPTDERLDGAKAALIEELRRERDDAVGLAYESEEAATEPAPAAAPAGGSSLKDEADRLFDPNYARNSED
mgnify:CR=1 FL=1